MHHLVLHLGSNLAWRNRQLLWARKLLREQLGPELRTSAIYETSAWGVEDQPDFLNQACLFETPLTPEQALATALEIEQQLGRQRIRHWGERCIDIDLIFYEQAIVHSPTLTLPHPWMHERRFVLAPLAEIVPDWKHPILQKTVTTLLAECEDRGIVVKVS
jgi:2-amino-4-hydroxy-6-hydroxymethyldihydropteridine diphosphokinase